MNGLGRAAQPLAAELERHGIRVLMVERTVISPWGVVQIRKYTPAFICRIYLRTLIKKGRGVK